MTPTSKKKPNVIRQSRLANLKIEKFIFHIIIAKNDKPHYIESVALEANQKQFFEDRFREYVEGGKYVYADRDNSPFATACNEIYSKPKNFEQQSRLLTMSFFQLHRSNMKDGVFIVSVISIDDEKFLFLLKMDNTRVLRYTVSKDQKASLEEIQQSFTEDSKAIQKWAIVDLGNAYSWDVLANEKGASSKYFRKFLTVEEMEGSSELTKKATRYVKAWANTMSEDGGLPDPVASYKTRSISYLESHTRFELDDFIDTVIMDADDQRKEAHKASLRDYLDDQGFGSQRFEINRSALTPTIKKTKLRAGEVVTVSWDGDAREAGITIPTAKNPEDGLWHIVIKTATMTTE